MPIPKRWEMATLLASGIVVAYTLRVNMSVTAQQMRDELNWSDTQKGFVLSSFYWGYTIGQLPSSKIAQTYGAKWLFGFSIAIPSFLTLLVPITCRHSFGTALLIRGLIGFFESASFPAVFHFFPLWIGLDEKTVLVPFILSGMYVGEIIGFSLSGALAASYGWPVVFYVFGLAGLLWFPIWALFSYETPEDHPSITNEELLHINKGKDYRQVTIEWSKGGEGKEWQRIETCYNAPPLSTQPITATDRGQEEDRLCNIESTTRMREDRKSSTDVRLQYADRIPWFAALTHPVTISIFITNFVYGWINFTILSEMPSYLNDVLGFNLEFSGILCVFPYFALFLSTNLFGRFFDYLQRSESAWTTHAVRNCAHIIAFTSASLALVICGLIEQKYIAYCFMIISQICFGCANCSMGCAYIDVAPNFSSPFNSMGNAIGSMAGLLGPIVVADCTNAWPGVFGWRIFFFLTLGISLFATVLWFKFFKPEIVPVLNSPVSTTSEKNEQ